MRPQARRGVRLAQRLPLPGYNQLQGQACWIVNRRPLGAPPACPNWGELLPYFFPEIVSVFRRGHIGNNTTTRAHESGIQILRTETVHLHQVSEIP
jgi:hypothetical protein